MTFTITIPNVGDLARMLLPLAEPCLVAAAGLAGLGPLGQAVVGVAVRAARQNFTD
ncbi:MAG TPA: hypothetical protein VGX23_09560 [Actinocrinis sp.]|nr:hypothetical protein [Actinocrinis sp.]